MPRNEKSSDLRLSLFCEQAEILRDLQKQNEIGAISQLCRFNSTQVRYRVGSMNPNDLMHTEAALRAEIGPDEDFCFESRKKRPYERGRKKRRKGKWNPMDRLWNNARYMTEAA